MLRPGGRLLAVAISRFASLLDGLYRAGWTTRTSGRSWRRTWPKASAATPSGRPAGVLHHGVLPHPGRAGRGGRAGGFTGLAVYGIEGPGGPLLQDWADAQRREQILLAARPVQTQPALVGFSLHLLAAAAKR